MSLPVPLVPAARSSRASLAVVVVTALTACYHRPSSTAERPAPETVQGDTRGSVESLTAEELGEVKVSHVEQLLEGRFAGVQVLRTRSGGYTVRIRGTTTLLGDDHPLYVVNGTPVQVDPERGLDWLSPADVERIDVLKGPTETAFYGARGANGVILIRTKTRR